MREIQSSHISPFEGLIGGPPYGYQVHVVAKEAREGNRHHTNEEGNHEDIHLVSDQILFQEKG